jgi:hypothetical protein
MMSRSFEQFLPDSAGLPVIMAMREFFAGWPADMLDFAVLLFCAVLSPQNSEMVFFAKRIGCVFRLCFAMASIFKTIRNV